MCNKSTFKSKRKQSHGALNAVLLTCAITANGLSYRDGRITNDDANINDLTDAYSLKSSDLSSDSPWAAPVEEEWNVVQRKAKISKPVRSQAKSRSASSKPQSEVEKPDIQTQAGIPGSSWAKVAAAKPKVEATAATKLSGDSKRAAKQQPPKQRTRLALKSSKPIGQSQPRLARGPGWCDAFSLARTIVEKALPPCAPAIQLKEESALPAVGQELEDKLVKPVRRVSWGDEHTDSTLIHIKEIENCLDEKWDWGKCTDWHSHEGRTTMLAGAVWYGMIFTGLVLHSWVL
jgi:hypothetical protein